MSSPAATARSLLRNRNFGLVWASALVSDTGDWLLMIALPLYVFGVTGSAIDTSGVFLAELLPVLVLGPALGVLVDRFDHRRTMIFVNLAQALALLPLLLASPDRLWIVWVVAAVEAALAATFTPAKQSLLPRLLAPDQLTRANSLLAMGDNVSRLIGAPLGGAVFALFGLPGVVLLDAASYLLSALLVLLSRHRLPEQRSDQPRSGLIREVIDGWSAIRRSRPLAMVLGIETVASISQGMFLVLFVVYVVDVLHASDTEVGLLRGVQAIGGVLGGLLVGALARRLAPRTLLNVGNMWPCRRLVDTGLCGFLTCRGLV